MCAAKTFLHISGMGNPIINILLPDISDFARVPSPIFASADIIREAIRDNFAMTRLVQRTLVSREKVGQINSNIAQVSEYLVFMEDVLGPTITSTLVYNVFLRMKHLLQEYEDILEFGISNIYTNNAFIITMGLPLWFVDSAYMLNLLTMCITSITVKNELERLEYISALNNKLIKIPRINSFCELFVLLR